MIEKRTRPIRSGGREARRAMRTAPTPLGLRVVAEGVETRTVADRLAELGCEDAQGYYISRPMPVSQYLDWTASFSRTH